MDEMSFMHVISNRLHCKTTEAVEIRALLCLIYSAGAMRMSHANFGLYSSNSNIFLIFLAYVMKYRLCL